MGWAASVATVLAMALPAEAVHVAQSVVVSENPVNYTPNVVDGQVNAIVQVGNRIIAAGDFSTVNQTWGGANVARSDIFAFDATTGVIDGGFAPTFDGEIKALAVAPDGGLFVGGLFNNVNGQVQQKLVKINATTGQRITTFTATANAAVRDLEVRGNTLYAGGAFSTIRGVSRANLAALDATTGTVSANLNIPLTVSRKSGVNASLYKFDVSPDNTKLVAIGNFTMAGGLQRWQAAVINLSTTPATVANWQTDRFIPACAINAFDTYMRDVDFSPDGSYFVLATTGAYFANTLCDTASRWESNATGTGLQPSWADYTGGDTLYTATSTGTAIYVGGHQRWMNNPLRGDAAGPGAVPREGIAALDPINGLPLNWNPGRDRGVGVFSLYSTPAGLWVGSDTDFIDGEHHGKIAMMPVAGGETIPPNVPYTLPNTLYNMNQANGNLDRRSFDGTSLGTRSSVATGVDWRNARGAFIVNGILYTGWSDGRLYARTFNGTSVGAAQQLNLFGLTNFPLANVTGMFFDTGRLYYTLSGDAHMFMRYFTPESRVVGAQVFTVSGTTDGLNWNQTQGMTLANGKIYFARTDGNLYAMSFANGVPVPGTQTTVSSGTGYNWASRGIFVFTGSTDTTPPTQPGKPSGVSNSPSTITLTWTASTDQSAITYRIYRDGGATPVGTSTTNTFTDTGLAPSSTHTYRVDAIDSSNNVSPMSVASDPITTQAGSPDIFSDDFSSGTFANWSGVTRLTIDSTIGRAAPPSARAQVSGQSAFAFETLSGTFTQICLSTNVNATSLDASSTVLLRLRTAANGPVSRVYAAANGTLWLKSDVSNAQISSGTTLGTGWHNVEVCGTVGAAGTWDLYRDSTRIVTAWSANTGTTPVGRIEIGDTGAKTFTANFDDVVADQTPG